MDISIPKTVSKKIITKILLGILILGLCLSPVVYAAPPPGVTTAPYTISYSAKLTNAAGVAVTTAQSVRFSIWTDSDSDAADYLPAGGINPAAGGFTGWQETHAITPDANGLFHVQLGSINTLPNFTSATHIYLEVDVKPVASPDTAFEVLDPDGNTANLTDRHPINSGSYAINADTVDNRDAGTGAGQIPFLDPAGQLPISVIPGGTNNDSFILDFNDTVVAPGKITLQFGSFLAKVLEYDTLAGWFNFNDDVNITGNLTVTGTINGVPLGPYNQSMVFEPQYGDAVIQPDGTSNKGTLKTGFTDTDGTPGNANYNYYSWTTNQPGVQDNDLVFRIKLPEGFTGFQPTPVEFTYRTLDGVPGNNMVDLTIEDTAGTPVVLTGATGLVSPIFAVTPITFVGAPVFIAGQTMTVKIKLSALNAGAAYAGQLKINYIGK